MVLSFTFCQETQIVVSGGLAKIVGIEFNQGPGLEKTNSSMLYSIDSLSYKPLGRKRNCFEWAQGQIKQNVFRFH